MNYLFKFIPIVLILSLSVFLTNCSSVRLTKDASSNKKRTHKSRRSSQVTKPAKTVLTEDHSLRENIIKSAMRYKGIHYVYGGKTPSGFDCSGFTSHVFKENGVSLTGASRQQATVGKAKPLQKAEPGDLVFFKNKGKVTHVSIVVEKADDKLWVVHSTSSRGVVKDEILHSSYWKPKIAGVRDIIQR